MSTKFIATDTVEFGNENPFEELMARVESFDLRQDLGELKYEIESLVLSVERDIQDLSDLDTESSKLMITRTVAILNIILPLLNEEASEESFELLKDYLLKIKQLIERNKREESLDDINEQFEQLAVEQFVEEFKNRKRISVEVLTRKLRQRLFRAFIKDPWDKASILRYISKEEEANLMKDYPWNIEIEISNDKEHKGLHSLWLLIESLSKIEGVDIQLDELEKGSIRAKLRAFFEGEEARKEAQRFLDGTRKFAHGKLTNEYYEAEKNRAESEKLKIETRKAETELDELESDERRTKHQLENERLKITLERERLENEKLKLELFQKKYSTLKEMLADEILSNEDFKMIIDDVPFLIKTGGNIEIGPQLESD